MAKAQFHHNIQIFQNACGRHTCTKKIGDRGWVGGSIFQNKQCPGSVSGKSIWRILNSMEWGEYNMSSL
eukprot:scaffold1504_cov172-Ochromonas_danica.AAC.1